LIIVDTNVISEPTRPLPNPAVLKWLNNQPHGSLCFTAISLGEILVGIASMPKGKRREVLSAATSVLLLELFGDRILPYDAKAAGVYAEIVSKTNAVGLVLPFADSQIAAIAKAHNLPIASRDFTPFNSAGLKVINPWLDET
jgi:toxin FitB